MKKGIYALVAALCFSTAVLGFLYFQAGRNIMTLEGETAELRDDVTRQEQEIRELTEQNQNKAADIQAMADEIVGLNMDLSDRDTRIEGLTADVADRDGQIESLTADVADRDARIEGLTADVADRDGQIESLAADAADRDAQIAALTADVADRDAQIENLTADAAQKQQEMDALTGEISGQEEAIREQQEHLDSQAEELLASGARLEEARERVQTVAGLRLTILERLRDCIARAVGDDVVVIGENGSIILRGADLFALGSWEIRPESRPILDPMIRAFFEFLSDGETAGYVDSIVIAGHTDSSGGAMQNRAISTYRAGAMLDYLLEGGGALLEPYAGYFCAAGYGGTRPVESNDTPEGRAANRRIEIDLILNEEAVLALAELDSEKETTGTEEDAEPSR